MLIWCWEQGVILFYAHVEVPPLVLLAVCALPEGPAFETPNEDLPQTGGLKCDICCTEYMYNSHVL